MQFQLIQGLFEDKLYFSAQNEIASYLKNFKNGQFQETVLFYQIRCQEVRSNNIAEVSKQYHAYRLQYPKGQWAETAMFAEGYLKVQQAQYTKGISLLKKFQKTFPKSHYLANTHYWIGKAHFSLAETDREAQNTKSSVSLYQQAVQSFLQIKKPSQLSKNQRIDRAYLLGWAYHFQQETEKSKKWLLEYTQHAKDKNRLATTYYQLGQSEWMKKNYAEALRYFEQATTYKSSPLSKPALFSTAEMHYLLLPKQTTTEHPPQIEPIIALYQAYLDTNEKQYESAANYRLGELYTKVNKPKKSIDFYQRYLKSGQTGYAANVNYELGKLFDQSGNFAQAITHLEDARKNEIFKNDGELIHLLAELFGKTNQRQKQHALLAEAKDNITFSEKERRSFQIQATSVALENNQCQTVLKDLAILPSATNQEEMHYLLYARGQCFMQERKWDRAESDLKKIQYSPKYKKSVFDSLITIYQNSGQWEKLATLIEKYLEQKDAEPISIHFQRLVNSYHELQNWEKVISTYTRWELAFKDDVNTPEFLTNWAQVEEKLRNYHNSKNLYEKALAIFPTSNLDLREQITSHLADLFLQDEDYQNHARVLEQYLMPYLKNEKNKQKYALKLGKIYYDPLKQYKNARKWLHQADQGEARDVDIEAGLILSSIEQAEGKIEQAIKTLDALSKRPLQRTKWNVPVHYQLAALHEQKKQWAQAVAKYQVVVKHSPVTQKSDKEIQKVAKSRIHEIESFLAKQKLDQLIQKKLWKEVSQLIKKGLKTKYFSASDSIFETLVFAENEQKEWEGVLDAYKQWKAFHSKKAENFEALLTQGQAADQLGLHKQTKLFYSKALNITPTKSLQTRIFLTKRLAAIYEDEKNYKEVVKVYEKTYPFLKSSQNQIHFAFTIASLYLTNLKQEKQARTWFKKADQGGIREEELSAIWQLAELDKEKEAAKATKLLAALASRPLSKNPQWYILINYQLAILYHTQEKWQKAKIHYDRVVKAKEVEKYQEHQQYAKEQSQKITEYLQSLKTAQ
ncbi:MAG: outer membrane protein assembly factor BamD [SAR324 cluster bacterium]|nr:outer membrane protein assembly factor BamD [SAR324 cluster bacterium]